ncbi:hypothetical protein BN946_scf184692.g2 [Trametes cinnabarina]|uniref:Major facilitator superfamily (MFS) profile domain-containing protein n=1 Tax=Pycnoporus cinnabarinus TaxID=5643 RepID=A0A060T073_PYCCI|nr:hypothetical protein BN946_scf184692.g2 [Trametes cinnabarina]
MAGLSVCLWTEQPDHTRAYELVPRMAKCVILHNLHARNLDSETPGPLVVLSLLPPLTLIATVPEKRSEHRPGMAIAGMTDSEKTERRWDDKSGAEAELTAVDTRLGSRADHVGNPSDQLEYVPDGGKEAWTVVLGSSLALFASAGMINAYGAFQDYYKKTLLPSSSASYISLIGSLQVFFLYLLGTFTGRIFDAYGTKYMIPAGSFICVFALMMVSLCENDHAYQVLLSQGVLFGIGIALLFSPSIAVLGHWFRRRRALAIGLTTGSSAVGGVVFPIILEQLIPRVGFGWAVRIIAFILLVCLSVACLTIRTRLPLSRNLSLRTAIDLSGFKDPRYTLATVGSFLLFYGFFIPYFYIQTYANFRGVSPHVANYLLSILNTMNVPSRIIPGYIADKVGPLKVFIPAATICSILILGLWLPSRDEGAIVAFSALYGLFSGAYVSLLPTYIATISPRETYGARLGSVYMIVAVATLVGTPTGGALLKVPDQHHFNTLIVFCGVMTLAAYPRLGRLWTGARMSNEPDLIPGWVQVLPQIFSVALLATRPSLPLRLVLTLLFTYYCYILIAGRTTGEGPIHDYGIGSAFGARWVGTLILAWLCDPMKEWRYGDETHVPADYPLLKRWYYAACIIGNPRLIGWNAQCVLLLDLVQSYMKLQPLFLHLGDDDFPRGWRGFAIRFLCRLAWYVSAYAVMELASLILAIFCVATGFINGNPQDWRPTFGNWTDAYTEDMAPESQMCKTIANSCYPFQEDAYNAWIQYFTISGRALSNALGFKMGTNASSYTQLYTAFALSGVMHVWGDFVLGSEHIGKSMGFFLANACAITFEDAVIAASRRLLGHRQEPTRWTKRIGYLWVIAWFYLVGPLFVDWYTQFPGIAHEEFLPFSLIRSPYTPSFFRPVAKSLALYAVPDGIHVGTEDRK